MSQDVAAKFEKAERLVKKNRVEVLEDQKWKLYGLAKQAREGDCKAPKPPSANTILKTKWDAWTACSGMSEEVAMLKYIEIVEDLKATQKSKAGNTNGNSFSNNGFPSFYLDEIIFKQETRAGLSKKVVDKLERTCKLVLDIFEDSSSDWVEFVKEKKLIAKKNIITPLAQIKAEQWMPFSLVELFSALITPTKLLDIHDNLDEIDIQEAFSAHTYLEHRWYSKSWLTASRHVICMKHWRMLSDGRILIIFYSDYESGLAECPNTSEEESPDCMHADILPSGILLQAHKDGTLVKYTSHIDLKDTFPSYSIPSTCQHEAKLITRLHDYLLKAQKKGKVGTVPHKAVQDPATINDSYHDIHKIARAELYQYWYQANQDCSRPSNVSWFPSTFHHHFHHEEQANYHLDGLPMDVAKNVEEACMKLLGIFQPSDPMKEKRTKNNHDGWEVVKEENDLRIERKQPIPSRSSSSSSSQWMFQGELFTSCSLLDVASSLLHPTQSTPFILSHVDTVHVPAIFSSHNTLQHFVFKKNTLLGTQDMVILTHWRRIPSTGAMLICFLSNDQYVDFFPSVMSPRDSSNSSPPLPTASQRGKVLLGGFLLSPHEQKHSWRHGTLIQYFAHLEVPAMIRWSPPFTRWTSLSSFINPVAYSFMQVLPQLQALLRKNEQSGKMTHSSHTVPKEEELIELVEGCYAAFYHAFPSSMVASMVFSKSSSINSQDGNKKSNNEKTTTVTTAETTTSAAVSAVDAISHSEETFSGIPEIVQQKLNSTCEALLRAFGEVDTTEADWLVLVQEEASQYVCKRRLLADCPTHTYLKMEVFCPYSLFDVALFVMDPHTMPKLLKDSVQSVTTNVAFSQHTCIQNMVFRRKFVFSARDAVYLGHWRMLSDGSVLICFVSDDYYDVVPIQEEVVRTEMILGGYWLQPCGNGTKVNYLSHVDLRGSIPEFACTFLCYKQSRLLLLLLGLLNQENALGRMKYRPDYIPNYDELSNAVAIYYTPYLQPVIESSKEEEQEGGEFGNGAFLMSSMLLHPQETRKGLPERAQHHLESICQELLVIFQQEGDKNVPGWEVMFSEATYISKRKIITSSSRTTEISVKLESVCPYSVLDVAAYLFQASTWVELFSTTTCSVTIPIAFTRHSAVFHLTFESESLLAAREQCLLLQWRMYSDGSVLFGLVSDHFGDKFVPANQSNKVVREEVLVAGFYLQPHKKGTHIQFLSRVNHKRKLFSFLSNRLATHQAKLLQSLTNFLDKENQLGRIKYSPDYVTSYAEVATVAEAYYSMYYHPPYSAQVPDQLKGLSLNDRNNLHPSLGRPPCQPENLSNEAVALKLAAQHNPRINIASTLICFVPFLIYILLDEMPQFLRVISAVFTIGLVMNYLIKLHFGKHLSKTPSTAVGAWSPSKYMVPPGKMIFRLAVRVPSLLAYLENQRKLQHFHGHLTFTHIVVKACAMAIAELPSLNGHVVMNQFYRTKTPGVDVSVFVEANESLAFNSSTIAVKIEQAEKKDVDRIAQDMQQHVTAYQDRLSAFHHQFEKLPLIVKQLIDCFFPYFLREIVWQWLHDLGNLYGIEIPKLGIVSYPYGVCTVVTSPDAEQDVDVSYLTTPLDSSAPIVVTMGGYRVMPVLDTDGRIQGSPVINICVAIQNQAATGEEAKKFVEKLRGFLNDPGSIEVCSRKEEELSKSLLERREF